MIPPKQTQRKHAFFVKMAAHYRYTLLLPGFGEKPTETVLA